MSLADALAAEKAPKPSKCSICRHLRELDKPDADALRDALADKDFQHAQIARALTASGFPCEDSTVGRHRRLCQ